MSHSSVTVSLPFTSSTLPLVFAFSIFLFLCEMDMIVINKKFMGFSLLVLYKARLRFSHLWTSLISCFLYMNLSVNWERCFPVSLFWLAIEFWFFFFFFFLSTQIGLLLFISVDLKGLKAQKILVQEAKSHGEATLIVGISKSRFGIWPSASLAKYCTTKLPKNFCCFHCLSLPFPLLISHSFTFLLFLSTSSSPLAP